MNQESEQPVQKSYAFEGLDNAGKTTLITKLQEDFEEFGMRVAVLSSPGKTWMGKILKCSMAEIDPESKNRLFTYDIRRTQRNIDPTKDLVLWDRHLDSVVVSNGDNAQAEVEQLALGLRRPDSVLFLSVTSQTAWQRESSGHDHPLDFAWLQQKHDRYEQLVNTGDGQNPGKFVVFDANQPIAAVYNQVKSYLMHELQPVIERKNKFYDLLLDNPGLVRFLIDNPFEVKPGVYLPMFLNFKSTWGKPELRSVIVDQMSELVKKDTDWIVGLESGGSYYAVAVANSLGKPVSLLRKNSKDYGDKNYMVGDIPPAGAKVTLIDDVFATGQASSYAVERLAHDGADCSLVSIFSYSNDSVIRERIGAPGAALSYFKGLRRRAVERGILTEAEAQEITKHVDIYRNTRYL